MSQASSEARGASREAHSEAQKHRQDGAHRRQRFKGWLRDLRRLAGSLRKPARPQKRLQRMRAAEGFKVVYGGPQTAKGVALSALSVLGLPTPSSWRTTVPVGLRDPHGKHRTVSIHSTGSKTGVILSVCQSAGLLCARFVCCGPCRPVSACPAPPLPGGF